MTVLPNYNIPNQYCEDPCHAMIITLERTVGEALAEPPLHVLISQLNKAAQLPFTESLDSI